MVQHILTKGQRKEVNTMKFLDKIQYSTLIIFSIFLGLAPFYPQPHIVEKLKMLSAGTLSRPIDIFDLFFHAAPVILLVMKLTRERLK